MKNKKTIFKYKTSIRKLNKNESIYRQRLKLLIENEVNEVIISILPIFASYDNKIRPLIFDKNILNKIETNHGKIIPENLIINANDWDYVIKNVDGNRDKINLIKMINNKHYLTIGVNRFNGFFIVTHYESRPKKINTIKNLLINKGDSLNRIGGSADISSFATSSS